MAQELVLQRQIPQDLVLLSELLESFHLVELGLAELVGVTGVADLAHKSLLRCLCLLATALIAACEATESILRSFVSRSTWPATVDFL